MSNSYLYSRQFLSKKLTRLYIREAQKSFAFSIKQISILLLQVKQEAPTEYAKIVVGLFHDLMYISNSKISEKRTGSINPEDDFVIEPRVDENARDGWTGFETHNEPHRRIEDL